MDHRKLNRALRLETLEQRKLLAADIDLVGGHLEVQGTNYNDVIELRFDSSNNLEVEIDSYTSRGRVDGDFEQFDLEDIQTITVRGFSSRDRVRLFHEDPANPGTINLRSHFDWITIFGDGGGDTIENETAAPMRAFGGADDDTIRGGSSDDEIFGGDDDDWLYGGNGDDVIRGENGQDHIYGQDDHDQLFGGAERDWLYGGRGNDFASGEGGWDIIYGDDGHDRLYGHNDNLTESNSNRDSDRIYGGLGQDVIRGGGGMDFLFGSDSSSTKKDTHPNYLYGDDEDDNIHGGSLADFMYGLGGDDLMFGHDGNDRMYGGTGDDSVQGMDGDDLLYGNTGQDRLYGGDDDDRLDGGLDGLLDYLEGGSGSDIFVRYGYYDHLRKWRTTEREVEVDWVRGEQIAYNFGYKVTTIYSF